MSSGAAKGLVSTKPHRPEWLQKSEDILTPEGVMEVWMLEAEHVPKMDFFGSGQPYGKYVCLLLHPA